MKTQIKKNDDYNELEYWNKRNNPMSSKEKHLSNNTESYLKTQLQGVKTVLDFGCGDGRLFYLFKDVKEVVGCDITERHLLKLKDGVKKNNYKFTFDFIKQETVVPKFPIKRKFDVVVCSMVLLHMREKDVVKTMKELVKIGKKVVVISYYSKEEWKGASHCFNYDYEALCKKNKIKISSIEYHPNKIFFIVSK